MAVADEQVAKLVAVAELLELRTEDLDGALHECVADQACTRMNQAGNDDEVDEILEEWEAIAGTVNNGGIETQIRFLMLFAALSELIHDFEDVIAAREVRGGVQPTARSAGA